MEHSMSGGWCYILMWIEERMFSSHQIFIGEDGEKVRNFVSIRLDNLLQQNKLCRLLPGTVSFSNLGFETEYLTSHFMVNHSLIKQKLYIFDAVVI